MAFYWYQGKKAALSKSTTHRAVRCAGKTTPHIWQRIAAALHASAAHGEDLGNGIFFYEVTEPPSSSMEALPEGVSELPVFLAPGGGPMILTEEFNVKFKPEVTRQEVEAFNTQNGVGIVRASRWEENAFVLATQRNAKVDALAMANRYHESGLTLYAEPNFLQLLKPV